MTSSQRQISAPLGIAKLISTDAALDATDETGGHQPALAYRSAGLEHRISPYCSRGLKIERVDLRSGAEAWH